MAESSAKQESQDRNTWIEGWKSRIKADEFIHGLGEAYPRHNGRPAKVKLIRADINPPQNFDLSEHLPRFSQGNEQPLNLTEKVNRVVMERMRAAKGIPKEDTRNTPDARLSMRQKRKGKSEPYRRAPAQKPPNPIQAADEENGKQSSEPGSLKQSTPTAPATQFDPSRPRASETSIETSDKPVAKLRSRTEKEKLEWHGTWDDD